MTTTSLKFEIETLTATKGTLESIPLEVAFESVVSVLSLVRVVLAPTLSCLIFCTDAPPCAVYSVSDKHAAAISTVPQICRPRVKLVPSYPTACSPHTTPLTIPLYNNLQTPSSREHAHRR